VAAAPRRSPWSPTHPLALRQRGARGAAAVEGTGGGAGPGRQQHRRSGPRGKRGPTGGRAEGAPGGAASSWWSAAARVPGGHGVRLGFREGKSWGRILGGGLVWIWAVGLLREEGARRKEASACHGLRSRG
jgi:hypothetical protein